MALLLRFRMLDGKIGNEEYLSESYYRHLVDRGWRAGGLGTFDDEGEEFTIASMEDESFEEGEFHEVIVEKARLN
ncbi:MAG: hypothetical protein JWO84_777 [Parcubacteria group bacterium]|nr:hypothetical protein [Parcubacteria group bacterium]